MSITTTFEFNTPDDYSFDPAKVEVVGGKAQLKLVSDPGKTFEQEFASDAGFTYDSGKAEFIGGLLRQKSNAITEPYSQDFASSSGFTYDAAKVEFSAGLCRQINLRPTGATCCAKFDVDKNFNWADGSLTGTLSGDASVHDGRLDLTGAGEWYFSGSGGNADAGADSGEKICYRLHYIPNYTGAPAANQQIMEQACTGNKNTIFITHRTANDFWISLYDSSGVAHDFYTSTVSMVAGTEYVLELNVDFAGTSRFFVNGILKGSLNTSSWTRTNGFISTCYFNRGASANGNYYLGDVILFNTVQHTADHAGELPYIYPSTVYSESLVTCPAVSYTYLIDSFGVPAITSVNAPKYIVNGYYWNGAAWAASSDTYATAMSEADWITNIGTFPSGQLGSAVTVKVVFQGGNILSSIDSIAFTISEHHYLESQVLLPIMTYPGLGTVQGYTSLATVETNAPRYTVDGKYWTGTAWSASDGSFAQANSLATVNANLAVLVPGGSTVQMAVIFSTGIIQMGIDNLVFTYIGQVYPTDNPSINPVVTLYLDSFTGLVVTVSAVGTVKYIVEIDTVKKYWSGTAWVASDGTYSKSNTVAEINTNLGAAITDKVRLKIFCLLHGDGSQLVYIESFALTYHYAPSGSFVPNICTVYCFTKDVNGNDSVDSSLVSVELCGSARAYDDDGVIIGSQAVVNYFDHYWSVDLVPSALMEAGTFYLFTVNNRRYKKVVPDAVSKNFLELVDF